MAESGSSTRRLYLHVGLHKTGTSYLQAALLASRPELAEQGVDLVPPTKRGAYQLMLAVRGMYAQERTDSDDRETVRSFSALLSKAPGSRAVCSQESLGAATPDRVARLLEACGDREVHVVLTVRDLGRQLSSSWQQALKSNRSVAYGAYLRRLQAMERADSGDAPWINLDPVTVLERWSATLPPHQVHVVTVPPRGSPITLLLERFCQVLEVDPTLMHPEDRPSNRSLGRVQAELLRRVNAELPDEMRQHAVYGNVGKRFFAAQVLRAQNSGGILVPAPFRPWCESVTERVIHDLDRAGYDVVGSLDDLRCSDEDFTDLDVEPTDQEIASAAVTALAEILTHRGRAGSGGRDGRIVARPAGLRRLRQAVPAWAKNRLRPTPRHEQGR